MHTLFFTKDLGPKHHVSAGMKMYCENTMECRRVLLMWKFTQEIVKTPTNLHLGCDICATVCTCADCQLFTDSDNDLSGAHNRIPRLTCALSANLIVQTEIRKQLLSYRNALFLKSSPESALVGHKVCTGLTMKILKLSSIDISQ